MACHAYDWPRSTRRMRRFCHGALTLLPAESTVYVGGDFGHIGATARAHLAAVDATTGAVTPWNPGANARVRALSLAGSRLYAGGDFTQLAGVGRRRLGAVDPGTGAIISEFTPDLDWFFYSIAATDSKVYVTGDRGAAAFDANGGLLPWNPGLNYFGNAVALSGQRVFFGGAFTAANVRSRNRLAALDLESGRATAWAPRIPDDFSSGNSSGSTMVTQMAQVGETIYFAGGFDHVNGVARQGLAATDSQSGATLPWDPRVEGIVDALAIVDGVAYFGGSFFSIAGKQQKYAGAVDLVAGTLIPWSARVEGPVQAVAVSGGRVYLGGRFESIDGAPRMHLAALDAASGTLLDWNPSATSAVNTGFVNCLLVQGDRVWAGGEFNEVGGVVRRGVVALDANTGAVLSFDARLVGSGGIDGSVSALALDENDLYIGGIFTHVGITARSGLARLDATTGALRRWNPAPVFTPQNFLYTIRSIQPMADAIAIGGTFRVIGQLLIPQTGIAVFPRVASGS
jgi:hypothetical protein